MMNLQGLKSYGRRRVVLPVLLAMLCGTPAAAFQFNLGEVNGSLDTTLSYGLSWRVADRDMDIAGSDKKDAAGNPVDAYSRNNDDGNLNYDDGDLISNTTKITSELALDYNNFGLFVRGTAFYDFENEDGDRARTHLSNEALDLVGSDAELLDAYIWGNFEIGNMPSQVRVGDQVLSWGESTFIQNGINVINPFNVSALRVPGSELKEGLVPVGMVSASISPTENLTFEAFYQYDWEEVKIDPAGSYWSTNDSVGAGGDGVMLGFGRISDLGASWQASPLVDGAYAQLRAFDMIQSTETRNSDVNFNRVPRGMDIHADNDGQYGVAMRVYAPGLNDTEFGFYYMNYHSRLPVISSKTGTATGALKASLATTAMLGDGAEGPLPDSFSEVFDPADPVNTLAPAIMAAENIARVAASFVPVAPGVSALDALGAEEISNVAAGAVYSYLADPVTTNTFQDYVKNEYTQTAEYFLEYPEDIQLFGVSFNTVLPDSGVALQGEISYRRDVPLQVDDLELLFATLGPISGAAATYNQLINVQTLDSPYEQLLHGYKLLDMTQVQTTATKLFGPTFGADQLLMVGEVGFTHVHDMPSKSDLRFDGPGTPISGNTILSSSHYGEVEPAGAFADADSWGYRMVGKLDFNDAIGAVTLSPRIAWAHDVNGNSPGPGGNFIEGRKAITFGLGASYQATWSADLSYTDFFGAGRYNLVNDRDFVALNIKYSF